MTQEFLNELITWYGGDYRGSYVPNDELPKLLPRAYDIVNNAIALSGISAETAPAYVSEAVKNAICAETDYLYGHGGVAGLASGETASSMSLGSFSYSGGGGSNAISANAMSRICEQARSFLAPTGLLYKAVCAI